MVGEGDPFVVTVWIIAIAIPAESLGITAKTLRRNRRDSAGRRSGHDLADGLDQD